MTRPSFMQILKRVHPAGRRDPERDWLMLLIGTAILLAGTILWNIWAFDTVANGGTIGSRAPSITPVFSQTSLDAIHTVFADRATEQQKYVTGVYSYADPSQ